MEPIRVGLVADPAAPTDVARRVSSSRRAPASHDEWDLEVVSEPFTTGSEEFEAAAARLDELARQHDWDVVVGLTELPLHADDGRFLLVEADTQHRAALISLPALGGVRMHARAESAVRKLVEDMISTPGEQHREALPRVTGRWRLLLGMVLANRPWLLVPGLKSALVAALATGAIATINSTVWMLASSLSWWRLLVASVVSIALVVGWLVIDGELWDRPEHDAASARRRSRLYNASTLVTLTVGVLICYVALYVVNLLWALFILDPSLMGSYLRMKLGYGDVFVLTWFVASAATVGGGLGTGLESDEAIRAAAYSKREEERRHELAHGQDQSRRRRSRH